MIKRMLKSYDYSLIFAVFLLCGFGLVMVYSSSMITAVTRYGQDSSYFFDRQLMFLALGTVIFLCAALFPYKAFANQKFQKFLLLISVVALFGLFVVGHVAGNAQSWFRVSNYGIQPGEFVKLTIILYLSSVYAKKQSYIDNLGAGIAPPAIITLFICALVAAQPDVGTAFIIALIALCIILCSGFSGKTLLKLVLLAGIVLVLVSPLIYFNWDSILTEGRMKRFESYQNPFKDAGDSGFQVVNSYLAIGSGGLFGLGLGESVQKYGYLPETHTDFIMAVIAEELGIFGVLFVVLLLAFIVLKGFYIARKCDDPFGSLLAIGISSMIAIQSFVNLGGISGLIPLTGVTLPFISYGGSSLILLMASAGILVNISMFNEYFDRFKRKQPVNTTKTKENQYKKSINF
ncbi:FtsW/RodA/SpoVE family cell cycle protein [Bacillus haynesii]|uniref:Probable peptidoglycan glycosyltransferase FtsW n=1 Tax=Bacillus haynesii TaxID=1925021 RepID=A0AA90EYH2_9BACI|nr:FtsW/RodA/SpoVE family cell cycle protein [Bacillus haynesii]MCY7792473.1 FtsW/RodA/SpoVE family cell cycle protein [Bacillus haynesii]MCY7850772.1 FtsW/RodA/SpoVE family cell cycle protein [Bacillus haynesii]MCY8003134.1 FtsW/RodA/SpoVE family cell cycle protein [Bacillus haynesii]MCY8045429.1 FtsW/RodA/SpoVE family cell cycle protein [Bacillus haynesii]MCY8078694.1 FtsW/RodA/SpoVE family cell cycle protein [Bacillus haynesii]